MELLISYIVAGLASVILAVNIWRNTLGKDAKELKVTKLAIVIGAILFLTGWVGLFITVVGKIATTYDFSQFREEDGDKKTYFRLKFKK